MKADVAFGDHHEAGEAARVLAVLRTHLDHDGRGDGVHAKVGGQAVQKPGQPCAVGQPGRVAAVAVDHQVDTECMVAVMCDLLRTGGRATGRSRS